MKHFASPEFWELYKALPHSIQDLADKSYSLFKNDPHHPSLRLKKAGRFWSVRIGLHYRAVAVEVNDGLLCFESAAMRTIIDCLVNNKIHWTAFQPASDLGRWASML